MGIFDHLFKSKPDAVGEKGEEPSPAPPGAGGKAGADEGDPTRFLHPQGYGAGGDDPLVPVHPPHVRPPEKKPAPTASPDLPEAEVVLTLADILPRIPTHFLSTGMHDLKRELRFDVNALSPDIARGRASVPLSRIAALCPEIFHSPIGPLEDVDIRLPLQKVVEQIGHIRSEAHPRPHGAEAPRPAANPPAVHGEVRQPAPAEPAPSPVREAPGADATAAPSTAAEAAETQIQLSVAAILPGIPRELIVSPLPQVDESLRIALPFAPIEQQLAGGRVAVSSGEFVSVLPAELRPYFAGREGVNVPLPIEEVFQNLPHAAAQPAPAAQTPAVPEAAAGPATPPAPARPAFHAPPVPEAPRREHVAPILEVAPQLSAAASALLPASAKAEAPTTPAPAAPPTVVPPTQSLPTQPAAVPPVAAPAASTSFVPPVILPPVRLFAPPPPVFGTAKVALPVPDAAPPAAGAPAIAPRTPAPAPAPQKPVEPAPAPPTPISAQPAPPPAPTPPPPIAAIPAEPAPMPSPAIESPTPILRASVPEPASAPAATVRPLILQPPLLFGQAAPAAPPAVEKPSEQESTAPEPPSNLPQIPPEPAEDAPAIPQPIERHREPTRVPVSALPALPLKRFDQDSLQALFMTEEVLDLQKISRLAASLPGVQACVIATRETAVTGGTLPEGFDVTALLGLAPRVGEAASRLPIGGLKHFTLYGEHYSVSFFERSGLCLCAVHRPRSFVPGVREKLVALADELAG